MVDVIVELMFIVEEAEKLKGYWDEKGLDMHIAVKTNNQIAVSSKHWARVYYIATYNLDTTKIWVKIGEIMKEFGRKLIKSKKGP